MRFIDRDEVALRLTYDLCIPIVRTAMIALSKGETRQLLRSIIPLGEGRMFGIMPGAMGEASVFGAKLISVFPDNFAKGVQSHQGLVVLFDGESGAPVCVAHAGEVTAIRTAAASAVATDVLARSDARRLAILGYGEQATTHARAISKVRPLEAITVWGRSADRAGAFAARMSVELGLSVTAAVSAQAAVASADIICTVTNAAVPILRGRVGGGRGPCQSGGLGRRRAGGGRQRACRDVAVRRRQPRGGHEPRRRVPARQGGRTHR